MIVSALIVRMSPVIVRMFPKIRMIEVSVPALPCSDNNFELMWLRYCFDGLQKNVTTCHFKILAKSIVPNRS